MTSYLVPFIGLSLPFFHLRPVSRCLVEGACWSWSSRFGYLHMLSLDISSFPSFVFLLYLLPPCRSTFMRYLALHIPTVAVSAPKTSKEHIIEDSFNKRSTQFRCCRSLSTPPASKTGLTDLTSVIKFFLFEMVSSVEVRLPGHTTGREHPANLRIQRDTR
ncbi:hypothetical protein GALMADRAFT_1240090 [Galerina marginata CBS 339.88]|uniref:Uncharacterized protein n=1 Tax=Galerina marginata (strain CBS 339.88) TaxID=685588 RepID=A0A067THU0_GALM3|nr:hypothetical protein GALMADRAFT_1240090 [Galerina marginata CBS 339.88]